MTFPRALLIAALTCGFLSTSLAHAQDDFWREVREPGARRSQELLRQGVRALARAKRPTTSPAQRRSWVENAIERLSRAQQLAPTDVEPLFYLASAVALFERPRGRTRVERLTERAIELFEETRRLDPDHRADEVAFELAILHTREHRFDRAVQEYERALESARSPESAVSARSNLAEVTMMSGDVEGALPHFAYAIRLAERAGPSQAISMVLALFGQAVALDRFGDTSRAFATAARAYHAGGNLDILSMPGVFFEPRHEIFFYQGLAHHAVALDSVGGERGEHLEEAISAWESYAAAHEDDAHGWATLARQHLAEAREELTRLRR